MHDLCDRCERLHRAGTDAGCEQQVRKVLGAAIGCGGECGVQATWDDILRADVMMRGHDQMRQQRLARRRRLIL
jgi:hypothetical protein